MKELQWKKAQAPYIKTSLYASYGAFEETRPVTVDCSLGINPVVDLYDQRALSNLVTPDMFIRYPAGGAHGQDAVAQYVVQRFPTVKKEEICFASGSQGAISSLSRVLGGPGVRVQGFIPTFIPGLLEFATAGATVDTAPLDGPEFPIKVDALIQRLTGDTTVLYLDNPNNPTGQVTPIAELERLGRACLENGTLLIVDEAYGDFVHDGNSVLNLDLPNLICLRSFSKGCGLAGLRLGYIVIKDPELRASYRELGLHFSSSVASGMIAGVLLPTLDLDAMRVKVRTLKERVLAFLGSHNDFFVAKTDAASPIMLLGWKKEENLYDALMDVGIQAEPSIFFELPTPNYVRLRSPGADAFDVFRQLFTKRFG